MSESIKSKYISSAFLLIFTSVLVKIIGAVYKIPLTAFIGATGRGYFAVAYNLYLPLHTIIMGAFPIALSKLVSKNNANNNKQMVYALKKASYRFFLIIGLIGMAIMILVSNFYVNKIANSPGSLITILVLAPSILFSCLASSYRGYFEGFLNMIPTSISQFIEAVFKLVFGLLFARISMNYLLNIYNTTGSLFCHNYLDESQALSLIYPITSACAMAGTTFGTIASYVFTATYYKINKTKSILADKTMVKTAFNQLFMFSLPIMISCGVQSVFQFLDTASIQYALSKVQIMDIKSFYSSAFKIANVVDKDITTYVYGLLSTALDFKNIVPGITMALGVCAVPAISAACEVDDNQKLSTLINSILKYTVLLSSFAGIFLAIFSNNILNIFYGKLSPDIVTGCSDLVKYYSITTPLYSLAGITVFSVQAIGKPEKSIAPFVVSGVIRVVLNYILVSDGNFILNGSIISGAVGYFLIFMWNFVILIKYSKIKFDILNVLLKPIFVSTIFYFACNFYEKNINLQLIPIIDIMISGTLLTMLFVILCIVFRLFNFTEVISFAKCKKFHLNA